MTLSFHAHLHRNPYPAEIIPAGLLPPQVATEDDFACYAMFAKPNWVPVLLSFAQKYRLMEAVLAEIRRTLDGQFQQIVMTCRVPGVLRFPAAYNAPDIFKVADLAMETQRLRAFGIPFLAMHEGFVRHPMEQGENEFRLELHRPGPAAAAAFGECRLALRALGLDEDENAARA